MVSPGPHNRFAFDGRRWCIARSIGIVAVLAGVTGLFFIPHPPSRSTDQGPALRVASQFRGIVAGLLTYSQDNHGALPDPNSVVSVLVETNIASPELFTLREADGDQPAFFYIPRPSQGWQLGTPVPVVYTNPSLWIGERLYVGFSDQHTEVLMGDQAHALLAAYSARAVPLK